MEGPHDGTLSLAENTGDGSALEQKGFIYTNIIYN